MQTELLAAETLLENGVSLGIRTPFFLRFLGVKHLRIYQPSLGNRLRISKLYLEMGIDDTDLLETTQVKAEAMMLKHSFAQLQIIALCMFKGRYLPQIFNRVLAKWLLWKLNPKDVTTLVMLILQFSGTTDFMTTTRFIRAMKITTPKLGQKAQTS